MQDDIEQSGTQLATADVTPPSIMPRSPEQENKSSGSDKLSLRSVDIVTPNGEAVAKGVTVDVTDGKGLMVTGRSATGKSSLVRVLAGLWPAYGVGWKIERPGGAAGVGGGTPGSLQQIFVVPQRILMVRQSSITATCMW